MRERHHETFRAGEVTLHAVVQGEGPTVLLLHGFPEFWYAWRRQLPALADAGFRAIAPDLRGYNDSDRPEGVRQYTLRKLAADVAALARSAAPGERVHLVGHDWGGVIAWVVAHLEPQLVDKLVALNAPHPSVVWRELLWSPKQVARLWYAFYFQLPRIAEAAILRDDFLPRALRGHATKRAAAFTDEDLAQYAAALRKPGAATAALNYYRAMWFSIGLKLPGRVRAPTMVIWGEKDVALGTELLRGLPEFVEGPLRIERLANASHWVQHDEPERVNELLLEFLR